MILFFVMLIVVFVFVVVALRRDVITFISTIIVLSFVWEFFVNKMVPEMTYYVNPSIMTFSLCGLLLSFIRKSADDYRGFLFDPFIRWFILTSFGLIVFAVLRGAAPLDYFTYYRRVATGYLLLSMFLSAPPVDRRYQVFSLFIFLLLIESGLGLIQYFGPESISQLLSDRASYMVDGVLVLMKEEEFSGGILVNGTFSRFNIYGNTLTLMIIYLSACIILRKEMIRYNSNRLIILLIILTGIGAVFLSGNKMSVISLIVGYFVILSYKNIRKSMIFLAASIVVIILYGTFLQDIGVTTVSQSESALENPFERLLGVFALLDNPFEIGEGAFTTFTLTVVMIPYIISNPFFGAGLYYKGGYPFIYPGSDNDTDATLAFLLSELGIIGFTIFISIILYGIILLKRKGRDHSFGIILPVVISAGIQTVTDPGIFSKITSFLLVLMIGVEILYSRITVIQTSVNNDNI